MKIILLFLVSLFTSLTYASSTEKGSFLVDGKAVKSLDYLLPGQKIKVTVSSSRGGLKTATGRIGEGEFSTKESKSLTLEHQITKKDLKNGYVTLETYFQSSKGDVVSSFIKVIPVRTQKEVDRLARETDEEKLKRFLKDFGVDKDKCDSLFKD